MKKITVSLLVLISLVASSSAFADRCWRDNDGYRHCGEGDDDGSGALAILASLYTTSTAAVNNDDRAIYIQNVQDDAAAFLAGNTESALLQEAVRNLRTATGKTGTDAQIATELVTATK